MKKLFILFLLTLTISSFAQRNSGLKFGSNISWTSSTRTSDPYFYNYYDLVPSFTYHFGYSWNIKIKDKFSIQTDLIYNWKGSSATVKNANDPVWYSDNYIEIAAIANSANIDKTVYFSLPITFNYAITPKIFAEFGGESSLALTEGNWNLWEFGITTGAGYCTRFFDISIRYTHGITPYEEIVGRTTVNEIGQENRKEITYTNKYRTFQISLTIPVFKHIKRK